MQLEKLELEVEALRRQRNTRKERQKDPDSVTKHESRSCPQEEEGKETVLEGRSRPCLAMHFWFLQSPWQGKKLGGWPRRGGCTGQQGQRKDETAC